MQVARGGYPLPPSSATPYPSSFDACLNVLSRERVPYALIGAVALSVLGTPRATYDVDFLISILPGNLSKLRRAFARSGFHIDRRWHMRNPLLSGRVLHLRKGNALVDLLGVADRHEQMALRRRKLHHEGGRRFYTVAPEDFVLMKLKAERARDWDDLLTVLVRHKGKINWPFLRRWGRRLGLWQEISYLHSLLHKS